MVVVCLDVRPAQSSRAAERENSVPPSFSMVGVWHGTPAAASQRDCDGGGDDDDDGAAAAAARASRIAVSRVMGARRIGLGGSAPSARQQCATRPAATTCSRTHGSAWSAFRINTRSVGLRL